MRLRGLHHVTAICADLERTIAFYRDMLGLAIVHDAASEDDGNDSEPSGSASEPGRRGSEHPAALL